ncbi:MAG: YbhB/YbcL family Raf kinase inhibitor-like protein [Chitinivibrionales bacterium]|nr:YbhB/YbcL family Raf kinase inhibitor-like protein [Chitinivibrionales bacterium]
MLLKSPNFENRGKIPRKYTAEGNNINPCLTIEEIPGQTQSLCISMEEPEKNLTHWLIFNVPVLDFIEENAHIGIEAINDFLTYEYIGPGPQQKEQHLVFYVFALDSVLTIGYGKSIIEVKIAMRNHIIATAALEGIYTGSRSTIRQCE